MKLSFKNPRNQEVRKLIVELAGERLEEFDAIYTGRSRLRYDIKAELKNRGFSDEEIKSYFGEFEDLCMKRFSEKRLKQAKEILLSVPFGTVGGGMRVRSFHARAARKLQEARFSTYQIVGAFGHYWEMANEAEEKKAG